MQGVKEVVEAMKGLEKDTIEIYYSTIIEAELFSFHALSKKQKVAIRKILNLGEIINVDSEIALNAARLRALSKKGYNCKLRLPDAIIAATAFLYDAVLVTRNTQDFNHLEDRGLRLWNPHVSRSYMGE
ncbi:MAG: type II toxin-antitoxin system VapC family toxin [Firmicutes bacterium]|nr:type II toxin-antitoxin system VapC family toxin [Bacillota bacterium]